MKEERKHFYDKLCTELLQEYLQAKTPREKGAKQKKLNIMLTLYRLEMYGGNNNE